VVRDGRAHCFDGAVFAAAVLSRTGRPALIMELTAHRDDDHVLCLFREGGLWGAVAKSNFTTLRYREPVFRNLRELALSYFEFYYNVVREKSLRGYSTWLDLSRFDEQAWQEEDNTMERIVEALESARHYPILPTEAIQGLQLVEDKVFAAGMLGADKAGLFVPEGT